MFWGPLSACWVLWTQNVRMLGQHFKVDLLSYVLDAELLPALMSNERGKKVCSALL